MSKHVGELVRSLPDWFTCTCVYACVSALRHTLNHARGRLSCGAEGLNSHISVVLSVRKTMTCYDEELNLQYA
jgi:hypothetical protein